MSNPASPPAQQLQLDPAALAQAFKAAGLGQQTPQQQAPPSPQELAKLLNKFEFTDELFNALRSDDPATARQAYAKMIEGVVKEAVTVSSHYTGHHVGQLRGQLEPISQQVGQISQRQMFKDFYKANPGLKQYDSVVKTVLTGLAGQEGLEVKSNEDLYKLLAETSESTIKQINPNFTLQAANTAPTQAPGASSQQGQYGGAFEPAAVRPANTNPTPTTLAPVGGGAPVGTPSGGVKSGPDMDSIFG